MIIMITVIYTCNQLDRRIGIFTRTNKQEKYLKHVYTTADFDLRASHAPVSDTPCGRFSGAFNSFEENLLVGNPNARYEIRGKGGAELTA